MAAQMEMTIQAIEVTETLTVSRVVQEFEEWRGASTATFGGTSFVEFGRGDKELQKWAIGRRAHARQVSQVIDELVGIQKRSTKRELGQGEIESGPKSLYAQKLQKKALKKMCEGSDSSVVSVTLPAFEYKGIEVAAISTTMPLNLSPSKGYLPPTPENLKWFFLRCHFLGKPEKGSKKRESTVPGESSPKGKRSAR